MFKDSSLLSTFPLAPLNPCPLTSTINMMSYITSEFFGPIDLGVVPMEDESHGGGGGGGRFPPFVEAITSLVVPAPPNDTGQKLHPNIEYY